jgi:nitrate/nitrite-specific signal transduction histidine kinase
LKENAMTTTDGQRPFIEKVANDTREYIQSILDENHRLVTTVTALENKLQEQVAAIEEETKRFSARFVEVEQQNTDLANLYVASYQLHGTLDRQRVLNAIQEIVINLIGSEELAVFEMGEHHDRLTLAASVGIDQQIWSAVPINRGIIGHVASTGERFVEGVSPNLQLVREVAMTACIPLKLDEKVIGVIAIFGLLPQKQELAPVDHELFDLLATHAATALFCTRIQKVLELMP